MAVGKGYQQVPIHEQVIAIQGIPLSFRIHVLCCRKQGDSLVPVLLEYIPEFDCSGLGGTLLKPPCETKSWGDISPLQEFRTEYHSHP